MLFQIEEFHKALRTQYDSEFKVIDCITEKMVHYAEQADIEGDIPDGLLNSEETLFINRLIIPAEYGGSSLVNSATRRLSVFEKVGAANPGLALALPGPGISLPPVAYLGTEKQKKEFFELFLNPTRAVWGAFAVSEPKVGSDATAVQTTAIRKGDNYILNGTKCFITNGSRADRVIVFANVNPKNGRFGVRAFAVPKGTPGFDVQGKADMMGMRASQMSTLTFSNCELPVEFMLGHNGKRGPLVDAITAAQHAWDYMRPVLSAIMYGSTKQSLARFSKFIEEDRFTISRKKKKLLEEKIKELSCKLEATRLLAYRAAWLFDKGENCTVEAAMIKAKIANVAMEVGVEINAALSLTDTEVTSEFDRFYRDAKAYDIMEGTGDMQRKVIGELSR